MEMKAKDVRRNGLLVALLLALIAAVSLVAPAPAQAAQYPSGCWTTAEGGSVANHRKWCWVGANGSVYDNASNMAVMIQRILKGDGYYSGLIDGQFGGISASSTISYQNAKGLVADGVVGSDSWVSLMYSSILDCGILGHTGYSTYAYRISTEGCGRYIQQRASMVYMVRAYNNNGTSPADPATGGHFVTVNIIGPTADPSLASTSASSQVVATGVDVDVATATELAGEAELLGLTLDDAVTETASGGGQTLFDSSTFSTADGVVFQRTVTWADQATVDDYFDRLQSYPGEFAYVAMDSSADHGVTRSLDDGTWQAFVYDASSGALTNLQVDATSVTTGLLGDEVMDLAHQLLS